MPTPITNASPVLAYLVAQYGTDGDGRGVAGVLNAMVFIANNHLLTTGIGQNASKTCAVGRRSGGARQAEDFRSEHRHGSTGCG